MVEEGRRDFVKHSFFKVSTEWRRLPPGERDHSKNQFAEVVAEFSDRIAIGSYSLVGTRGDVDFMLWKISPALDAINELLAQLKPHRAGRVPGNASLFLVHDPAFTLRGSAPARRAGRDCNHYADPGAQVPVHLPLC